MKIIWHSRATQDLNKSIQFISERSPQNALVVLDSLLKLIDSLSVFPYKYPMEPIYNNKDIRFVTKWSFKIVYRIDKNSLIILRIFNTKKRPESLIE